MKERRVRRYRVKRLDPDYKSILAEERAEKRRKAIVKRLLALNERHILTAAIMRRQMAQHNSFNIPRSVQ